MSVFTSDLLLQHRFFFKLAFFFCRFHLVDEPEPVSVSAVRTGTYILNPTDEIQTFLILFDEVPYNSSLSLFSQVSNPCPFIIPFSIPFDLNTISYSFLFTFLTRT